MVRRARQRIAGGLAHGVFVCWAYTTAMRPALGVAAVGLLFGALGCALLARREPEPAAAGTVDAAVPVEVPVPYLNTGGSARTPIGRPTSAAPGMARR